MNDQTEWEFQPDEPTDQLIEKISSMLGPQRSRWPQTLLALIDVVNSAVGKQVVVDSKQLALRIVVAISFYIGGRSIYLPRGDELKEALRDIDIYERWRACPDDAARQALIADVQLELGCTDRHVWRIIAVEKARRRPKQAELLGVA